MVRSPWCKGRGVCPSCNGRRMAQTAAHLVDRVIPPVPVRQWVISVPKRLRCFLADRPSGRSPHEDLHRRDRAAALYCGGLDPCRRQAERSSPATRRRLLSAPLRIGAQSPCAPACVRDRRRLRAACRHRAVRHPAGVPAGPADHPGRSGHAHREGAPACRALVPHAATPRRRCGQRYGRSREQRVLGGRQRPDCTHRPRRAELFSES